MKSIPLLICSAVLCVGCILLAQDKPSERVCEVRNVGDCGVTAPKPIYHPDPEYTDRARKKKINGNIVVSFIVTSEGEVRDAAVTRSLDKDLDKQALAAVRKWRFEPALKDGTPVEVRLSAELTFRLY
ncbi:MAG TPA: energy transducer TonB [Candidatus Sulfotelmatobacter sp.]|nr:energy transducer TonB [Candidatus Sulfotelmatobacter sp.]